MLELGLLSFARIPAVRAGVWITGIGSNPKFSSRNFMNKSLLLASLVAVAALAACSKTDTAAAPAADAASSAASSAMVAASAADASASAAESASSSAADAASAAATGAMAAASSAAMAASK
jgi:hypothetical protein